MFWSIYSGLLLLTVMSCDQSTIDSMMHGYKSTENSQSTEHNINSKVAVDKTCMGRQAGVVGYDYEKSTMVFCHENNWTRVPQKSLIAPDININQIDIRAAEKSHRGLSHRDSKPATHEKKSNSFKCKVGNYPDSYHCSSTGMDLKDMVSH